MERSAEWLRGAIEALNRAQRDFTVTVPELQAEYVALLAAAEARESFPIPDTLPAVPEAREAGEAKDVPETNFGDLPTAAEVIAVGDNNNFYVPVFQLDKANESSAKREALAVVTACEKYLKEMLFSMPDKIDPRMKYREVQYRDSELDDIRELLALIARWKAGRG